jgi:hypothetical protein
MPGFFILVNNHTTIKKPDNVIVGFFNLDSYSYALMR